MDVCNTACTVELCALLSVSATTSTGANFYTSLKLIAIAHLYRDRRAPTAEPHARSFSKFRNVFSALINETPTTFSRTKIGSCMYLYCYMRVIQVVVVQL